MSSRGATWHGPHYQTKKQKYNSRKNQRNRKMDDAVAKTIPVGGMSYDELQHHVRKCQSKIAHKSAGAAYQAKLQAEKIYGVEYQIYECVICGKWHLTTHPWEDGDDE